MAKTITIRDIKTGEALYPDVLVSNAYDSNGNNLTSILSKKADLVDGIVPLSQLPAVVVTGGDSLKGVVVNGVTGSLDASTGSAIVNLTAKNIKISSEYVAIEAPENTGYVPIQSNTTIEDAVKTVENNVVSLHTKIDNLISVVGVKDTYKPSDTAIYIKEVKTLKEAVDILDASLNLEVQKCKDHADNLLEWAEKD
jgi:hypothetical protein